MRYIKIDCQLFYAGLYSLTNREELLGSSECSLLLDFDFCFVYHFQSFGFFVTVVFSGSVLLLYRCVSLRLCSLCACL